MTAQESFVYAVVYWFHSLKDGKCIASNQRILEVVPQCKSTTSIQNALTALEEKGFIQRTYSDPQRRNRTQIIPLVDYAVYHPQVIEVSPTGDRGYHPQVTRSIKEKEEKKDTSVSSETHGTSPKKKKTPTLITKAESADLISKLKQSEDDARGLIGYYLSERGVVFSTKEAFDESVRRHLRPAHTLVSSFTESNINRGFDEAKEKFPEEYTLETIYKMLTK